MVNKIDMDAVMKDLKLLKKGTEDELGKVSVREDYTKNERGQIKKLVDIAKDQECGRLFSPLGCQGNTKKRTTPGETHQALTSSNQSFNTIKQRDKHKYLYERIKWRM